MTQTDEQVAARPAGSRALVHALLSAAVALVGVLVFATAGDAFLSNFGVVVVYVAGITALGAVVVGLVKRLTGGAVETTDLRRSVMSVVLVPVLLGLVVSGFLSFG